MPSAHLYFYNEDMEYYIEELMKKQLYYIGVYSYHNDVNLSKDSNENIID